MPTSPHRIRILTAALVAMGSGCLISAQSGQIPIVISTDLGEIAATLDSSRAPITVANFLKYLDAGQYSGGAFHRTVTLENQPTDSIRIQVIQGRTGTAYRDREFATIPLEGTKTTGLRHQNGTLSMARSLPNSATSAFFITIGEQPSLDEGGKRNADGQGFAAFGRVTAGMDVVTRIQQSTHVGQALTPPIVIHWVRRASVPSSEP